MSDERGRRFRDTLELEPEFVTALLDTVAALVIVLDAQGHILRFNRACEFATDYRQEEVKGKLVWELFFDPLQAEQVKVALEVISGGSSPIQSTVVWLTKGGERRLIEWTNSALAGDEGEVELIIGTGMDITERQQAEQSLQDSEARFRRLAQASFEGIVIHDRGEILDANIRFAKMLGFDHVRQVVGTDGLAMLAPGMRARHLEMIDSGHEGVFESQMTRADGTTFPVEVQARPVPFEGRQARVAAVRDITERKQAEQQQQRLLRQEREARADAEAAVGLRDEFLSVASHELRSPLTSLQLGVQSLLHMVGSASGGAAGREVGGETPPEVVLRTLEVASRQANRLARLVNDLLDISRLQAGRFAMEPEPMDLALLAQQVLERFEPQLHRADCPLVFSTHDPVEGCWDPSRLDQCLSNLLANAVKYGAGGPVEVRVEALPEAARLVVKDQGIGVPEDRQEEIFSRFGRAVSSRNLPGLGLGLYIVRRIVAGHGGTVIVDSAPGKGATFTVELPYGMEG